MDVDREDVSTFKMTDDEGSVFDRECLQGETIEVALSDDEPPEDEMESADEPVEMELDELVDESLHTVRHTDSVLTCVIRRDGDGLEVVTGGMDDVAIVWRIGDTCAEKVRLEGHTDSVNSVAYSHDNQYLATGSYDGNVRIWNSSYTCVSVCEGPTSELEWCRWHPKGHVIIAGSADMTVWMWWAPTGKVMQVFGGHGGRVSSGTFTTNGKGMVTGAEDGGVIIWNPKEGTATYTLSNLHQSAVVCICPSPNESTNVVVTGGAKGGCKVVHAETGKQVHSFGVHKESVDAIGFSNPDALVPLLATGDLSGRLAIWDALSYASRASVDAHSDGITALQWIMDLSSSFLLVTCSLDSFSKLWDGRSGMLLRTFSGHQRLYVLAIDACVIETDIVVASASDDETCKIFRHAL